MNDDLISRQAAIDALKNRWKKTRNYEGIGDDIAEECELYLKQVPSAQPSVSKEEMVGDTISRQAAIKAICEDGTMLERQGKYTMTMAERKQKDADILDSLPSSQPGWIPVTERLPEDAYPVIVTWKNDDPKSYYQYILGKHYTGVAHFKNGIWYWYSSTTEDVLMEYGRCDSEEFDEAIQVLAWQPLPTPYREGGQDEQN